MATTITRPTAPSDLLSNTDVLSHVLNENSTGSSVTRPAPELYHAAPYPRRLVRVAVAPMHGAPDDLSEQVSQGLLGMEVLELAAADTWRFIQSPDGYQGWMQAASLCAPSDKWQGPWAEVTDLWANLRGRQSSEVAPVMQAVLGVRLPLAVQTDRWAELVLPEGRRVWTETHRVQEVASAPLRPATPTAVCDTARRLLGVPYLWGGCSPFGLDCSGFVQLVLRLHGVPLLRDAGPQATQGLPVEHPHAGDLVFFGRQGDGSPRITHVGMMLDDERFIHAAGGQQVRIDVLRSEPYLSRFRQARRYLPETNE